MKRFVAFLTCLVLLASLLSGCSLLTLLSLLSYSQKTEGGTAVIGPSQWEESVQEPENTPVPAGDPVVQVEEYAKQYIPYDFGDGFMGQSSFDHLVRVPALTSESTDAQRINQEIHDNCQRAIDILKENAEGQTIYRFDYAWKNYNGIVGLLVDYTQGYQSAGIYSSYAFYFFDANQGIELSYDEYLAALGMTQESALDAIRAAGLVDPYYDFWEPELLIVDETGTIVKATAEPSMDGYILNKFDYSILEYPLH